MPAVQYWFHASLHENVIWKILLSTYTIPLTGHANCIMLSALHSWTVCFRTREQQPLQAGIGHKLYTLSEKVFVWSARLVIILHMRWFFIPWDRYTIYSASIKSRFIRGWYIFFLVFMLVNNRARARCNCDAITAQLTLLCQLISIYLEFSATAQAESSQDRINRTGQIIFLYVQWVCLANHPHTHRKLSSFQNFFVCVGKHDQNIVRSTLINFELTINTA